MTRQVSPFPLKAALLSTAAAAVISLAVALPAAAATPCWRAVINDWVDGRVDGTYPVNCYRQAIPHLPADLRIYSSAEGDITRALQARLRAGAAQRTGSARQQAVLGSSYGANRRGSGSWLSVPAAVAIAILIALTLGTAAYTVRRHARR
jgi:hypothetical protein